MAKKVKARKAQYPGKPQVISNKPDDQAWFYTQPRGLLVVTEVRPGGIYQATAQTMIPWKKVLDAVAVHNSMRR